MEKFTFLLISLFVLLTNNSILCGMNGCVRGKGDIKTQQRQVEDFSGVQLQGSEDVVIKSGNEYKVVVKDYENLLPLLKTEVRGGVLQIYFDQCVINSRSVVEITMPKLEKVISNGSGNITISGDFKGQKLSIKSLGSGDIIFNGLVDNMDELLISTAGSGNIRFNSAVNNVDVSIQVLGSGDMKLNLPGSIKELTVKCQGSGDVTLSGDTTEVGKLFIMGSGDIDAEDMALKKAEVKTMGSGDVSLTVLEALEAKTMGSGDIIYYGEPQVINVSKLGSGEVIKR